MRSAIETVELITTKTTHLTDNISKRVEESLIKRLLQACICEQLLQYFIEGNILCIPLNRIKKTIIAHNVQHLNLGKFKMDGEIILSEGNELNILNSVRNLLDLLHQELIDVVEPDKWKVFAKEIENCSANDVIVKKFMRQFNHNLSIKIKKSKCNSLLVYIDTHYSVEEKLIFFEAWATRGHPYHPCHKTKLGFSQTDYLEYSPEFNRDINLPLAAIEKSLMHFESEKGDLNYNNWFEMQFPQQWNNFRKKLNTHGLSENEYYPIFIHPWQFKNKLTFLFHSLIENKKLILFKDIAITTKASLSFRTLIIKNDSKKPHIKIPVAIHSTSALRTNSPASVENGPKLTKILKQIFTMENHFDNHLKLAYESCGLHIKHGDPDVVKHLGIIYRENPANLITKNQLPIVVAALYEKSPTNNLPLFIEIMHTAMGESLTGAIKYFEKYCQIVLRPYLNLLLSYGIALEGHQQNTIAVFENSNPVFMIARDLSGLRIHTPILQKKGFYFEAYPNSEIITNDRSEVTNKFLHTVVQYHLGEIVLLLAQYYLTSENVFWKIIKNNIDICFAELRNKVDPERWQQEHKAILADDWQVKGLFRMRLNNLSKKYIYVNYKNPLRDL